MTALQQLMDRLWGRFEADRRDLYAMIGIKPEEYQAADKEFYLAHMDSLDDLQASEFFELLERTDKLAEQIIKLRELIALTVPELDNGKVLQ